MAGGRMLFDADFLRRLEGLRLAVRRSISGRREGERLTRKRGGSSIFTSHRSYTQGDEFRNIDWNLYGRLGQFYVKEFSREEALPVRILVDTSPSMEPKFDFARRLGAALAFVAHAENPSVRMEEIANLKLGAPFTVPPVAQGLLLVLSDLWDDELRRPLLAARAETAVVHVLSPEEAKPTLAGKLKLRDAETGETVVRFVGDEERADYGRRLAAHCEDWRRWCFDHDRNYLRCTSDTPLEEVVQVYLRGAGVLE